ncbi:MAG: minor coat protein [Betaproteobacteria bacterium]|nr:minor coat protein [Betaproteobacteria bacterium]
MAAWFLGLFTSLTGWIVAYFTKRAAITAAAIAGFISITLAFGMTINSFIAGIQYAATSPLASTAGMVIPSNASYCLGAIIGGSLARWAYDGQVKILNHWAKF